MNLLSLQIDNNITDATNKLIINNLIGQAKERLCILCKQILLIKKLKENDDVGIRINRAARIERSLKLQVTSTTIQNNLTTNKLNVTPISYQMLPKKVTE